MSSPTQDPWHGVFPSLPTPFLPDGSVDRVGMGAVVRYAIDAGAHGVVCFGLAGEVNRLSPPERVALGEVIVETCAGRVPMLLGAGAESTRTAVDLAIAFERMGGDGIVIAAPTQTRLSSGELLEHFVSIAAATGLPVMVQEAAIYLGVELSPDLVLEIAERCPNVLYLKVEAGPEETARWVAAVGHRLAVFTGDAGIHLTGCLRAGAVGNVPGVELTAPLVAIHDAFAAGDTARAEVALHALLPYLVFALQGIDHYNACAKAALARLGVIANPDLRAPAPGLSSAGRTIVHERLSGLGL